MARLPLALPNPRLHAVLRGCPLEVLCHATECPDWARLVLKATTTMFVMAEPLAEYSKQTKEYMSMPQEFKARCGEEESYLTMLIGQGVQVEMYSDQRPDSPHTVERVCPYWTTQHVAPPDHIDWAPPPHQATSSGSVVEPMGTHGNVVAAPEALVAPPPVPPATLAPADFHTRSFAFSLARQLRDTLSAWNLEIQPLHSAETIPGPMGDLLQAVTEMRLGGSMAEGGEEEHKVVEEEGAHTMTRGRKRMMGDAGMSHHGLNGVCNAASHCDCGWLQRTAMECRGLTFPSQPPLCQARPSS